MMGFHGRMDFQFPSVSNPRCKGGFCKNAWWRSHQFTSPQAFPVDGCNQLRLVVHPIIYNILYIPGGCSGFLNHQPYEHCDIPGGWFHFVWGWEATEHPGWLQQVCFVNKSSDGIHDLVATTHGTTIKLWMHGANRTMLILSRMKLYWRYYVENDMYCQYMYKCR